MIQDLTTDAIELLKKLIETPSFSSSEDKTASHIEYWFRRHNMSYTRTKNNVWATNKYYDEAKPNLLLNSHRKCLASGIMSPRRSLSEGISTRMTPRR